MKSGVLILFCIYFCKHTHFAHFSVVVFASLLMIRTNVHTFRVAMLGFHLLVHKCLLRSQALQGVLGVTRQSQSLPWWMSHSGREMDCKEIICKSAIRKDYPGRLPRGSNECRGAGHRELAICRCVSRCEGIFLLVDVFLY